MAKTFFSNAYAKEEKHAEQKKNGRTCQTFAKGKLTEKWVAIKEKLPVCMLDTYSTFQFFNSRYAGILHNFISLFFFLRIFFSFLFYFGSNTIQRLMHVKTFSDPNAFLFNNFETSKRIKLHPYNIFFYYFSFPNEFFFFTLRIY